MRGAPGNGRPYRDCQCLTDAYVRRLLETGMPANVFYANDRDTMTELMARKIPGIMTDVPDLLLELVKT